jgi:mannose-6-phosphate isomerase-like protein (cupin superfamily)
MTTEQQWAQVLEADGFTRTYLWQDEPRAHYADHTHAEDSAHVILQGQMTIEMGGRSVTCRVGDRIDVPAGTVHSATMGPEGCRYLIGERPART